MLVAVADVGVGELEFVGNGFGGLLQRAAHAGGGTAVVQRQADLLKDMIGKFSGQVVAGGGEEGFAQGGDTDIVEGAVVEDIGPVTDDEAGGDDGGADQDAAGRRRGERQEPLPGGTQSLSSQVSPTRSWPKL